MDQAKLDTADLIVAAHTAVAEHPEWRLGQAAFNVTYERYPGLADRIRGSDVDPFHDDARLPQFWLRVRELLT